MSTVFLGKNCGKVRDVEPRLSEYLAGHPKVQGRKVTHLAERWGIVHSSVSRILAGSLTPSIESMLRIAVDLKVHPAKLHNLAGQPEIAALYRDLFPEKEGRHPLQHRLVKLLNEGMDEAVAASFDSIEAAIKKKTS